MEKIAKKKLFTALIVIICFIFFVFYSYLRNIHFRGLDFIVYANFMINQAFTATSVLSIFISYNLSTLSKYENKLAKKYISYKRYFGLSGFYFIILHIFFGFRIISQEVLPQFFLEDSIISSLGKIIIILGIFAFLLFLFPAISSMLEFRKKLKHNKWLILQRIGYLGFFIALIHASLIGYQEWLTPEKWWGSLPPISLICVILILFTLILRLSALIIKSK